MFAEIQPYLPGLISSLGVIGVFLKIASATFITKNECGNCKILWETQLKMMREDIKQNRQENRQDFQRIFDKLEGHGHGN